MSRNVVVLSVVGVIAALWLIYAWGSPESESTAGPEFSEQTPAVSTYAPPPHANAGAAASPPVATARSAAIAVPSAEPEPEPEPASQQQLDEQITGDQGPVDEYRKLFESEARASDAGEFEQRLRTALLGNDRATTDLFKSVLCRQSVCRVELRWSMERLRSYVAALNRAHRMFKPPVALSPVGPVDRDGTRPVELFLMKRAPLLAADQSQPSHTH